MRIAGVIVLWLASIALAAPAWATPVSAESSVDDLLDALDARGKDLKTLTADVKMTTSDNLGEADRSRTGFLCYEKQGEDSARFRASFVKSITGKTIIDDKHDWLFTDGRLIDRDYHSHKQASRQVLRAGEKMQIFKLQGPFPLPLGQSKQDVHKAFTVKKLPPAKADPAGSAHLSLTPIDGTDLARKFSTIELWIDPGTSMPTRIDATDADGATTRRTDLTNIKLNTPLKDDDFQLEKVDLKNGWTETDDRFH